MNGSPEEIGYGIAGLSFVILTILVLTRYRGRLSGGLLAAAAILTAAWAFILAMDAADPSLTSYQIFNVELLQDAIWFAFFAALLDGAVGISRYWMVRFGGIILIGVLMIAALVLEYSDALVFAGFESDSLFVAGPILSSLYGLIILEQIYRNARESQRHSLKFLCLGVGAIFTFDLLLYSDAVLTDSLARPYWSARGYVVTMCAPLIAVAAQRSPAWSVGIFVSRQMVFYSATALAAAAYLIALSFVAQYFRTVGGTWGPVAQLTIFSAALLALFVLLFSDRSRARLRVFISKHFFENKYDYREEWLRLINTLTDPEGALPLRKRAIKSLAQIVGSRSGLLWLRTHDASGYECVTGWDTPERDAVFDSDHSLIRFLQRTGWVIEVRKYLEDKSRYEGLELTTSELVHETPAFIVPLLNDSKLTGFIVISEPSAVVNLNYEDRDLLKTAGQQIASYLAQELYAERLAEGRQFEAFSRLTAFLMHDMKNLLAQQSLIVENAERHRSNPDFVDDALNTVATGVARMRKVIDHLNQTPIDQPVQRMELGRLVSQAAAQCRDRKPAPTEVLADEQIWVNGDRDRLAMALNHAIRNAQDATPPEGSVTIILESDEGAARIVIRDTGSGMDEVFIRERLFRPFDSTKGTQGMGIGAYQIRETVRAAGGDIRVHSTPGEGTRMIFELKTAD